MKRIMKVLSIIMLSILCVGCVASGAASCSATPEPTPPNGTPNESTPPEKVPEYRIEYVADGETVGIGEYIHAGSELVPPKIPEKAGYTAYWEDYDITGEGNIVVNAIYEPITYTISYEVVRIENGEIERNYRGTWEEYWLEKFWVDEYPTEYTVEEEIEIPEMPDELSITSNMDEFFLSWYTNEECTEKFIGKIPTGTTGDIKLYAKYNGAGYWTGFY